MAVASPRSIPIDTIIEGDALAEMRALPDASIDLILTDPPYYKVKGEAWDRQWEKPEQFLAWMETLCAEWKRLLKPNGSLYVFASPQMAARVEVIVGQYFHVLNQIVWHKDSGKKGWHQKAHKESLRGYFPNTERIIFAEHFNSDNYALDGSGYAAKCEELRGFVFEPIQAYLEGERKRAGISFEQVRQAVECAQGSGLPSHWFTRSQWALPTAKHYKVLQRLFNEQGKKPAPPFAEYHPERGYWARYHAQGRGEYLRADYEDLRADYEDLRADYEDLRRPFQATLDTPWTDVWSFDTVAHYPGKHPCEKPLPLLEHIIQVSSRPGALVLDCFAGSGTTCKAARKHGRHFLGIDLTPKYVEQARLGLDVPAATPQPLPAKIIQLRKRKPAIMPNVAQLALFA